MHALIEVLDGGIGNSIQDRGRIGFRHMGITVSGWIDPMLARCANVLVGNDGECACIEIRGAGPTLAAREGRFRLVLTGDITATLTKENGVSREVSSWTSFTLEANDTLEVGYIAGGTAYLAIGGGIDTPLQLGSRSTYQRALIGGVDGRPLSTGNRLACKSIRDPKFQEYRAEPWSDHQGPIGVVLGPQEDHFDSASVKAFFENEYKVTTQLDRMGVRLEGLALAHVSKAAADIVSDGVTPGSIQVPGNGQPIILLADAQTVGGYPKVATVISADLPRLGQAKPGDAIRFAAVSVHEAREALVAREKRWNEWAAGVKFGLPEPCSMSDDIAYGWLSGEE
ncbi:MAG: biotin-dependent carboxyltransferase [Propionivibrio sp.]|nr:biotin-dependent carboxyltransferase [Propionivibrio sp.]